MKIYFFGKFKSENWNCVFWSKAKANFDEAELPTYTHDFYSKLIPLQNSSTHKTQIEKFEKKLYAYRVFPPHRMSPFICGKIQLQTGSVIIQRIHLGILTLETAVRIKKIYKTESVSETLVGFQYETLEGHVEKGIADFFLRYDKVRSELKFVIQSSSSPANFLSRITRPLGRRMQKKFTKEALEHFCHFE